LIADLTEDNAGAYWEAGFAEGLGRPVIYTCENGHRTHFDTRQQQTIFWTEDKLDEAAQRLKNTIRATLPSEAELDDNE
jgi:nucleoside 2-deoxyribosyltransferase